MSHVVASCGFCYLDYPSSTILNQTAPVLSALTHVVIPLTNFDMVDNSHALNGPADDGCGNDWEYVSVFVRNNQVQKVLFHQHSGQYTRVRGTFESEGERPVV